MRSRLTWLFLAFSPALAGLLVVAAPAWAAPLRVITTTTDLASLCKTVGGDKVEVRALVPPGFNVDLYQPRPSDLFKIHRARLFIEVGLGLEEWARDLIAEAGNSDLILAEASRGVPLLDVPTGRVDYSFGDIHPYGNPHFQLNPDDGRIMAANIFKALVYSDPADEGYFSANLKKFERKLARAKARWHKAMAPYRGAKFIPYHESWSYFAEAFGLVIPETIESKPGFVPSPLRIQQVIQLARKEKVRLIVTEPYYDVSIARLVAEQAGVPYLSLTINVGGFPEQRDYISTIDYIVRRFVKALSGGGN